MAKPTSSSGGDFGTAPGARVGGARYLLKRLVGRGEFSELWLARDVKSEKDVALKFLPRAFLQDGNLLEHLQQEVRRNGLLKHPHIVSTSELVVDNGAVAIAMEFVDGWSLATMKVDKLGHCYSVEEIGPWIRELCDALSYAHNECGMTHGDLKPSNLITSTREGIKVSDFGFAALIRNESTRRGIIKSGYGGIGFLSPQQVMGEPPSKLDDIYSLGATIFDLLTGTPPFYKGEIIAQVCSLKPPLMTQRLAELAFQSDPLPPVWEDTVAACLAKNPADRPQSVEEVLSLLERKELSPGIPTLPASDEEEETSPAEGTPAPSQIQEPINVPSRLESAPVSPANAKWIAVVFAGVLALLVIAGLGAVFWIAKHANFVSSNNTASPAFSTVSLDKNFDTGTGADGTIRCLALQPDGKILIGGLFTNFNGAVARKIARLNADGSLDTTFQPEVPGNVYTMVLQSDGKVLIGGQSLWARHPAKKFIRLEPDGSRDTYFRGEGTYNSDVRAITIGPDGAILIGGSFTKVSGQERTGLTRVNSSDQRDDSFDASFDGPAVVLSIAVQPDGKILTAGIFNDANNAGKIHLVRLKPDGDSDAGFDDAAYADENIREVLLQKDGKILACGYSSDTNGTPSSYLTRLNPDGSPDASFHFAGRFGDAFWGMAVQENGKIVVGGYSEINKQVHPVLVRLNADGSMDGTFQVTDATGGCIWSVAIQPDGEIIAAGDISSLDGVSCGRIVRLQD